MNFIAVVSIVELASIRAHNFELACRDRVEMNGDRKHGVRRELIQFTAQLCQDMVPDVSTAKLFM